MSTINKSGLQRSRSSSCIPQARLSRLPVRSSIQKNHGKSFGRPEKLSLDRNFGRSSSNLSDKPRLSRQRSGSIVRQTLTTPQISRSARKSPLMSSIRKDFRPIIDKHWQYEQTVKVRNFVSNKMNYLDHHNIKSGIPLELFVGLMDGYFQLIDKRITITRENYIEEVPLNLKRYHYLATVKPSLMKTVNTPHSWPHVLAIMSWLTDIISDINEPVNETSELKTSASNCVMNMYLEWNGNSDDTGEVQIEYDQLQKIVEELVNTDEEEVINLNEELANIKIEIESYIERKNYNREGIDRLKASIKSINEKCDRYINESETLEKQMKEQHEKLAIKITKIDQELTILHKTEEEFIAAVASQPHSFNEKQQLTLEIKDLQNSLKLREDRQKEQRECVNMCDYQISAVKQQMEANAYQYNNVINQLKLIDPTFKNLHIHESGFANRDTEEEIEITYKQLRETIVKLKETLAATEKQLEERSQKLKQIDEELVLVRKEEENASTAEAEINIIHAQKIKQDEKEIKKGSAEINKYENELLNLKQSKYDILPLQQELKHLENKKEEHLKFKKDLQERALDFFLKLEVRMHNNIYTYMNVMEEVTASLMSAQENAIEDAKTRIEKLKNAKKEVEEA